MASEDDSIYLQGASDEMVDNVCGPCKQDQIEKRANFYCTECGEYLCNECKNYHRKLSVTKNHTIVTGSEIPTAAAVSGGADLVIDCGCNNKKQEVEFYCKDHDDVFCSPCKNMQHHKCTTRHIQEISASYSIKMLNSVTSETESLRDEFEHLLQESSKSTIEASKETCKREIKEFRRDLDQFLNKLKYNLLEEVEKHASDHQREIDQQTSILADARNMLDSDYILLKNARQNGRATMFVLDLQVSKRLQGYKSRLTDLQKELPKPVLSFQKNKKLADIQTEIKELGYLKGKDNGGSFRDKRILMSSEAKIKLSEDRYVPWVSGCSILLTGELVLCDKENNKIKLLDTSGVRQDNLKLSSMPWDVSVIDENNVIVSLPNKKRLQCVQVLPQLKAGNTIQVGKRCFGVEVSGGEIYTTCHNNPGKGEIQVMDLDGNRKRRLGIKPDGSFMFRVPQYITVSSSGKEIFVSDVDTSTVTCMTGDGNIIYLYKDGDLKCPLGLYADAEDNIVVCDAQSNTVKVISSDGRRSKTLLSSIKQDVISLYSITYRKRDNTLVIGCHNADTLLLFELSY